MRQTLVIYQKFDQPHSAITHDVTKIEMYVKENDFRPMEECRGINTVRIQYEAHNSTEKSDLKKILANQNSIFDVLYDEIHGRGKS